MIERFLWCPVRRLSWQAVPRVNHGRQVDALEQAPDQRQTDQILGVHIVGPMASELIAEAVVAMEFKVSAEDIACICHARPSLSEVAKEATLAVDKRTLNFCPTGSRSFAGRAIIPA